MNAYGLSDQEPFHKDGKIHIFRPEHLDDRALWNAFREGDEQAFVIIFDRNVKPLYNYGAKINTDGALVQDIIQELFIELWKNRKTLGETDAIRFYLYKSLRRKLFRLSNRKRDKMFVPLPLEYSHETASPIESTLVMEQLSLERKEQVVRLLNNLSSRQREAIYLRYFEEMEYEKIAVVMDLSKQVVYNLVHKAIDSLRSTVNNDAHLQIILLLIANLPFALC